MKCKISKGDYAKLSYKLIFREWQSCKCQITREYSDFFFRAACVSGWKKKHLSCVITRLENHHHSNFYQAASILCWVKFTRTFKLSPRYCLLTVVYCFETVLEIWLRLRWPHESRLRLRIPSKNETLQKFYSFVYR